VLYCIGVYYFFLFLLFLSLGDEINLLIKDVFTSASRQVLNDNALYKSTYFLTYLVTNSASISHAVSIGTTVSDL